MTSLDRFLVLQAFLSRGELDWQSRRLDWPPIGGRTLEEGFVLARIVPFRGVRPRPELASQVASPPYDVLSRGEARALARDNPLSFLRVNRADLEFDDETPVHSSQVYERARENLDRLCREGSLVPDEDESFYLYRLTWRDRVQTGLVALTSVEEYERGRIKKHEQTRREKVVDRADHMEALDAQVGPVLSAFRANAEIRERFALATQEPSSIDFVASDGVRHQLWNVRDRDSVAGMGRCFDDLDALYVADGHHRSEAAAELRKRRGGMGPDAPSGLFLSVLFPHDELTILPYNRLAQLPEGTELEELFRRAESDFSVVRSVSRVDSPELHQFGVYARGHWSRLDAKPGSFPADHPIQSMDTWILARNFLAPFLGIEDERTDDRISFVGGEDCPRRLEEKVGGSEDRIAFSLRATTMDQLLDVADAGGTMPPKSTWFEPKLRSGIVLRRFGV